MCLLFKGAKVLWWLSAVCFSYSINMTNAVLLLEERKFSALFVRPVLRVV